MRALLTNRGFTTSVFIAIVITVVFAYVFEAPQELCAAMLIFGILTAVVEYILRSKTERPP